MDEYPSETNRNKFEYQNYFSTPNLLNNQNNVFKSQDLDAETPDIKQKLNIPNIETEKIDKNRPQRNRQESPLLDSPRSMAMYGNLIRNDIMRNGKINEDKHKKFIKILKDKIKKNDHINTVNNRLASLN